MKRTLVSLPEQLFQIMKTKLKGKFGENDSEIIRGIVIAYLSEQGYLKNEKKVEDINIQEDILGSVIDVLEDKGIVSDSDIDKKMREKIHRKKYLTKFKELK